MADCVLLFETTDREEAHLRLEEALGHCRRQGDERLYCDAASAKYPSAECREDHSCACPYQVWSGPAGKLPQLAKVAEVEPEFSVEELQQLKKLLKMMKEA